MVYMVTFTINIPPILVYIPYMDPMGNWINILASEISDVKGYLSDLDPGDIPVMMKAAVCCCFKDGEPPFDGKL